MHIFLIFLCICIWGCVAYCTDGQSGSGKTYTMAGGYSKGNYKARVLQPEKFGVTPRAIHHIFELKRRAKSTIEIKAYFVEIYNNKLRDLFFRSEYRNEKDLEAHDKGLGTRYHYDEKTGKGEVFIKGNPLYFDPNLIPSN